MEEQGAHVKLKAGQTLHSAVDRTAVIVIRAPEADVSVTCGGAPMVDAAATASGPVDPAHNAGTQLGKRYADEDLGIELLCTKPGEGTLAVNGNPLPIKSAKPLPASD